MAYDDVPTLFDHRRDVFGCLLCCKVLIRDRLMQLVSDKGIASNRHDCCPIVHA
jgi:hypothetical protein